MTDNLLGRNLGNYRIESLLGKGGMGAVYRGYDTNLRRSVAIKVMLPGIFDRRDLRERFQQEGVAAARLNHPGIVKVYAAESQGDLFYIVMEFIEGDNLQQMLEKQRRRGEWLSLADTLRVTSAVARALDHAHRHKILHRDIKPANIMMRLDTEGSGTLQPVLTDLGLAKLGREGIETQTNMTMGTPDYMSPEQALGEATDLRSDVYSLGVLLYELAVGQRPFSFKSITAATRFYAALERTAPAPSAVRPDLPPTLDKVIVRAMQVPPQRRFQSAAEMAAALEAIPIASLPRSAPPDAARPAPGLYTEAQNSIIAQRGETDIWQRSPTSPPRNEDIIQVARPDGSVVDYPVRSRHLTIGRDNQNEIQIEDGKVSRRHVRIEYDGHSYQVTDLDSMNGTVMGQRVLAPNEPAEWVEGQTLRVGKHYLRLVRAQRSGTGTDVYWDVTQKGTSDVADTVAWGASSAAVKSQATTLRWKKISRWGAAVVVALLVALLGLPVAMNRLFPGATAQLPRPVRSLVFEIAALVPWPPSPTPTLTPTPAAAAQEGPAPALVVPGEPPTHTPTQTPTATPSETATSTPSPTNTDTPSPTATATSTQIPPSPTSTPLPPTATPLPTATPIPTSTPRPPPTATFTPRPTPTVPPIVVPPTQRPTPTPFVPVVPSTLRYTGQVMVKCEGNRRVSFHGLVTANGVPQDGVRVVFRSYMVPGNEPATAPEITGAKPQFGCAAGCYEHIVDDPPEKGKHLEIYLIDANGRDISNRVKWDTDGPDGTCNTAEINFSAVQ